MLPGFLFFFLNASPSTGNMQNANVRLVKAVTPSSSAGSARLSSADTERRAFLELKLAASEARTKRKTANKNVAGRALIIFCCLSSSHRNTLLQLSCIVTAPSFSLPWVVCSVMGDPAALTPLIRHTDTHKAALRKHLETFPGCPPREAGGWH